MPAAAGMCEGNSQVFSEEFSEVPRTSAQVAQQASASGITGVLGVSAMDNSVTIITTVGASIVHGRCPLLLPDDQPIEKRRHQNHERIPERLVYVRGLAFAVRSRLPTVSRGAGARRCAQLSVKRQSGSAASRWSWASVVPQIWTVSPDARRRTALVGGLRHGFVSG
jgi:Catalase